MSSHLGNGKVKNISKEEALLIKELEVGYMPREGGGGESAYEGVGMLVGNFELNH